MMPKRRHLFLASLALPAGAWAQVATSAAGMPPIYAAGAVKHAVEELREGLRAAGRPVPDALYDTVGALRDRILGGDRPAVTLLSAEAVAVIAARGIVPADGIAEVGRTGVGLAAPAGRAAPDIATPEAFRAALLAADSIAFADPARGATAGRHVQAVLERMGLLDQLRPKLRLVPFGVEGINMIARGEVALAFSQATEIIDRPGVQLVGLLPDALQLWTVYRAAVIRDGEEARALMALFGSDAARAAFAKIGFRPA
ncbi:molybdate ABC transporter substrate-binding protein [Falsiroseomonas sp. CW058]|uniref:molybdate ABC transporter substrate-binding protein n=1 Tax=Falsiroseomonas sp. CW058 TaxID=3388664 RepID=UPI003D31680C